MFGWECPQITDIKMYWPKNLFIHLFIRYVHSTNYRLKAGLEYDKQNNGSCVLMLCQIFSTSTIALCCHVSYVDEFNG